MMSFVVKTISALYNLLWGDLFVIPLPGGSSLGLSLLVILLVPAGIYFTIRTRFLPVRLFPDMLRVTLENRSAGKNSVSGSFADVKNSVASRIDESINIESVQCGKCLFGKGIDMCGVICCE